MYPVMGQLYNPLDISIFGYKPISKRQANFDTLKFKLSPETRGNIIREE